MLATSWEMASPTSLLPLRRIFTFLHDVYHFGYSIFFNAIFTVFHDHLGAFSICLFGSRHHRSRQRYAVALYMPKAGWLHQHSLGITWEAGEQCIGSCLFRSYQTTQCDKNATMVDAQNCACATNDFKTSLKSCVRSECAGFESQVDTEYETVCASAATVNNSLPISVGGMCGAFCELEAITAGSCPQVTTINDTCHCYDSQYTATFQSCVSTNCPAVGAWVFEVSSAGQGCPADSPAKKLHVVETKPGSGALGSAVAPFIALFAAAALIVVV
ncbi:hypothetical protein BKA62DRAFT_712277 [Auriculariales sp. MPI-PUGE-AT-0066]|nr:hypothetical protein BKA62DRAFT_712277 [Auriculariales sp. MPI-PUGE-AT-0066]